MTTREAGHLTMARSLIDGTLASDGFSHRDHVAVAFEILSRHDVFEAMALYAKGLRQLTQQAGVPEKFNATVTFAFLSLIATRMAEQPCASAEDFLSGNPDLLKTDVLAPYFTRAEMQSELARKVPVLPMRAGSLPN